MLDHGWWTSLSMSSSPSMKCWLWRRRSNSRRTTMWWTHMYVPLIICWSYFQISYWFVILPLGVMVLCNNAAWCWLSAVAFHDACWVVVYNTIISALDFVCNMIMATRETAISYCAFCMWSWWLKLSINYVVYHAECPWQMEILIMIWWIASFILFSQSLCLCISQ